MGREADIARPPGTTLTHGATPFGNALVALCLERGEGFRALATEFGVPYRTLYQWVTEGRAPRLAALATVYANCPEMRSSLIDLFPDLAGLLPEGGRTAGDRASSPLPVEKRSRVAEGPRRASQARTSGQSFRIRTVRPADVPEVVGLVARILCEFGLRFGQGADTDAELYDLPASYTRKGGGFWVVEVPAGKDRPASGAGVSCIGGSAAIVGTAGVAPVGHGDFELRKMYLLPETRGLGAGATLLDQVVRHVRRVGGKRIVLDTVESMKDAIAFYERHGFRRDDAQIRGKRCTRGYVREL